MKRDNSIARTRSLDAFSIWKGISGKRSRFAKPWPRFTSAFEMRTLTKSDLSGRTADPRT
ncbi:MAG: hypothetical protein U0638_05510 [Phycisphaerales bacterium]